MRRIIVVAALLLSCSSVAAQSVVIDFGPQEGLLPYTEDGITFSSVSGLGYVSGVGGNIYLNAYGNFTGELRIRAESAKRFDLDSLDIKNTNQAWRIESSVGGVLSIPGGGELNLSGLAGFSGITRFEFINDGGVENAFLAVDSIRVTFVPEPSSQILAVFGLLTFRMFSFRRR